MDPATGDPVGTDTGNDVIVGDSGVARFDTTSGDSVLTHIESTDPDYGDDDFIFASDGSDVVLGGSGSDYVDAGTDQGNDIVVGDNGVADFDAAGNLTDVGTTVPDTGGDDVILTGDGDDVVLGGRGNDELLAGTGDDTVLGDNGVIEYAEGFPALVISTDTSTETAGDDSIDAGGGNDIVFGGLGNDVITGGGDNDILLGDNGYMTLSEGDPTYLISYTTDLGGDDTITGDDGDDILIGGAQRDELLGGSGFDILFGDNGRVIFSDGQPWIAETVSDVNGDIDYLDGGSGTDVLFGGEGLDTGVGEFPTDALIGEDGRVIIENGKVASIFPPIQLLFGSPVHKGKGPSNPPAMVVVGPIAKDRGLVMQTETGTIIFTETGQPGLPLTHHGSFGLYAGTSHYGYHPFYEGVETTTLPGGTIKRTFPSGAIETIRRDGTVLMQSPDDTTTMQRPDGTKTVISPDGTTTVTSPDGTIKTTLPDGTVMEALPDGTIIKTLPDGTTIKTSSQRRSDLNNPLPESSQSDIKLNAVVAGLTGWGLASSRTFYGKSRLSRKAFRELDEENDLRRFMRWQDGRFEDYMPGCDFGTEKKEVPLNMVPFLKFTDRRIYDTETRD
jgi:hypothetical protein